MLKYTHFAIVASFFCLWLDSFFGEKAQIIIAFSLIFTFGILHGANDLILIKRTNGAKTNISFQKNLLYYILVVVSGLLFFYILPIVALLLFILVSAFHFGDQQGLYLDLGTSKYIQVMYPFIYGIFILFLLFFFHSHEVENIVTDIIRFKVSTLFIKETLLISGFILMSLSAYFYWRIASIRSKLETELFFLLVFAILFKTSGLIWGFAIYFVIWHSIPSILDQIRFIYGDISLKNFKTYCKNGFFYWLASILGIGLLYFLFRDKEIFNALFFSFLAAITFPHVFVILKMMHKSIPK
ncbi:Brp/Blh family beta-carotene 15,15'-dioxygenase [Flavobacterium sp. Fl-77]|uniref:Probable beta-carotene 15,15'-dioxygenase n=1 Tax=Flavobacterium flavipigmentatum TaxID=2893884 RepID=A0AAJ2VVR5_9FLAO|nr:MULTISPECIES: Brp/Blh family beta-carotene 15,15'-dioxygenase [unclassified Flavobacterium]MDX6181869.1 Brp/Blh family beta-carotene 15,15'-dioxygenase [Flavobacterium sp. Fl-33]MDX6185097.1 Brp/Blh family beta-carotene 15,15'-dioxygenase [Flavobacterium sp. Fl-77]UFH37206.1 Brp/Blh family beta-carotene 15,15'-dioxygenase [Flavobacterium sp. F-70]